jgi:dihydrofolate synthase / folylpolyglutamate synthase
MTIAPDEVDLRSYADATRRLLAHSGFELSGNTSEAERWDIGHVRAYLDRHARPDARPTVHVAGSKGKGSIATMTEALLRFALPAVPGAARTMLNTSPDLHAARERIALDGAAISPRQFAAIAERVLADPATEHWSYFELLTAMAWHAATDAGCVWQVLEVGLGGRLDTTNAISEKAVAIIAPIDREHTAILGETIPQIAREKAGIITGPCEVVIAPQRASALDPIHEAAAAAGATTHEIAQECQLQVTKSSIDSVEFDLRTPDRTYRKLRMELLGQHQAENAATAVRAAELALRTQGIELDQRAAHEALAQVRLPGRGEIARRRPLTIVDGAHTPLAAKRLRQALDQSGVPAARVFVLGLLDGKDAEGIVTTLVSPDDQVIVCAPNHPRAAAPSEIATQVRVTGAVVTTAPDVATALERGSAAAGDRGVLIATGSMYSVAEAREALLAISGDRALSLR